MLYLWMQGLPATCQYLTHTRWRGSFLGLSIDKASQWTDCQSDFQTILLLCSWAIVLWSIRGVDVWLCRGSLLTLESTWHGHSLLSMQWGPLEELWETGISLLWRTVALVSFYNACVSACAFPERFLFFALPQFLNSSLPVTLCSPHNF